MQGILNKNMQGQPQAKPQAQPQAQAKPQAQAQGQGKGGEAMGKQVNVITNAMLGSLYGPALDATGEILSQGRDKPAKAIGRVISGLMTTVQQKMTEQNKDVPPGAMFASAMVASQAVGEMAMRMGMVSEANNGEVIEAGFMMGMAMFGKATKDILAPEKRQQYAGMIEQLTEGRKKAMPQNQGMSQGMGQKPSMAQKPNMGQQPQGVR